MNNTEIAYCAGLFEGEGYIKSYKLGRGWSIGINMTDIYPLRRFQKSMGGTIHGPYSNKEYKPTYTWRISGYTHVEAIFNLFKSYLSPRRIEQFENLLSIKPTRLRGRYPTSDNCGIGSNSGYSRHIYYKEIPCQACRFAHNDYAIEKRKKASIGA